MKERYYHKSLAGGRWRKLSFIEQMANVGSEVFRAIKWRQKNSKDSQLAFERALELLDLTIEDKKNQKRGRLKEILRVRELLADFFTENKYKSQTKDWKNYFMAFAVALTNQKYGT